MWSIHPKLKLQESVPINENFCLILLHAVIFATSQGTELSDYLDYHRIQ